MPARAPHKAAMSERTKPSAMSKPRLSRGVKPVVSAHDEMPQPDFKGESRGHAASSFGLLARAMGEASGGGLRCERMAAVFAAEFFI
jgi:hypothetical protein